MVFEEGEGDFGVLVPVAHVGVVVFVALVEFKALEIDIALSHLRFDCLTSGDDPCLEVSLLIQSVQHAIILSPNQIVVL